MTRETNWLRRQVLKAGTAVGLSGLSGCNSLRPDDQPTSEKPTTGSETSPPITTTEFKIDPIVSELTVPWDLAFAPDESIYFTERPGRINVLSSAGTLTRLADVTDTAAVGEGGLLGIALHPDFPNSPSLYVYQTYRDDGLHNRILRYRWTADPGLERQDTVLDDIPGGSIHDGGRIAFGPDGKLYATTGDASQGDLAQNRNSLAGKLLRLNPDGSIPSNNPFTDLPVWSYGHRNPEGLAWHPVTQHLYATEHGSSGHDEVNRIEPGNNYGWPDVTGKTDGSQFTDPVLESGTRTWAPSGSTVYGGDAFPAWQGSLFFTTLGFSPGAGRRSLHRIAFEGAEGRMIAAHEVLLTNQFGRLRAVAEGPDGMIYLATSNRDGRGDPVPTDDRILRLRPTNWSRWG